MSMQIKPGVLLREKHRVQITVERYRNNVTVQNNGNCCIVFYNQGKNTAWLFGSIKVLPGQAHEFNFEREDYIDTPIKITFDADGADKDMAVTKIYKD